MTNVVAFSDKGGRAVRITTPTRAMLLDDLGAHMAQRRGFTLATLNLDHVVKLRRNRGFHDAYVAHSHVVADGNPIVWLCRRAGQRIDGAEVELVPGSEMITPLVELAQAHDVPVAFVGSTPETLAAASAQLLADYPGLRIVAQIAPAFGFDPHGPAADAAIAELRESGARLVFLAFGAPKQEIFAVRAATMLPECGFTSIGAGLDFIAGSQVRAPLWVRKIAMEWAWRMMSNPKRLARRYAECFIALPGLMRAARAARTVNAG